MISYDKSLKYSSELHSTKNKIQNQKIKMKFLILLRYLITIAPFDRSGSSNVTVILSEPVTIKRTFVGASGISE
jgi:hypothetical protein